MDSIQLGAQVKDTITGFEGTVTGIVRYITGCDQALVAPKTKDKATYPESNWIDLSRLKLTSTKVVTLVTKADHPGACERPPVI